MQARTDNGQANPLDGLISDDIYDVLENHNLLSEKGVRDYRIRKAFKTMRSQNVSAYDAIEMLRGIPILAVRYDSQDRLQIERESSLNSAASRIRLLHGVAWPCDGISNRTGFRCR